METPDHNDTNSSDNDHQIARVRGGPRFSHEQRQELIHEAWEMRLRGCTLREIADELGVHHTTVRTFLNAYSTEFKREDMATILDQEVAALDKARRAVSLILADENIGAEMKLKAIDRWLRVSESKRKLLGLDAPEAFNVDGTITVETESERELRELLDQIKNQNDERRREAMEGDAEA